jgi:hypothetical protein
VTGYAKQFDEAMLTTISFWTLGDVLTEYSRVAATQCGAAAQLWRADTQRWLTTARDSRCADSQKLGSLRTCRSL